MVSTIVFGAVRSVGPCRLLTQWVLSCHRPAIPPQPISLVIQRLVLSCEAEIRPDGLDSVRSKLIRQDRQIQNHETERLWLPGILLLISELPNFCREPL